MTQGGDLSLHQPCCRSLFFEVEAEFLAETQHLLIRIAMKLDFQPVWLKFAEKRERVGLLLASKDKQTLPEDRKNF
jgi:hypothetical protein